MLGRISKRNDKNLLKHFGHLNIQMFKKRKMLSNLLFLGNTFRRIFRRRQSKKDKEVLIRPVQILHSEEKFIKDENVNLKAQNDSTKHVSQSAQFCNVIWLLCVLLLQHIYFIKFRKAKGEICPADRLSYLQFLSIVIVVLQFSRYMNICVMDTIAKNGKNRQ